MFYQAEDNVDRLLRLGDVVRGYLSPSTKIKQPFLSLEASVYHNYEINIEVPQYSVVLTPCCSIGDTMVSLTPLIQLLGNFFKNEYFREDFTRINREMEPQQALAGDDWERLLPEKQQEALAKGRGYTMLHIFVYAPHDLFTMYEKRGQETNYYMIDFRNVQTLKCDLIKSRDKTKEEETQILKSRCLQLSDQVREELRNKLSYYYGRQVETGVD